MTSPARTGPLDGREAARTADEIRRQVREELAGATWFELARATAEAHHLLTAHDACPEPVRTLRRERYQALNELLDERTAQRHPDPDSLRRADRAC